MKILLFGHRGWIASLWLEDVAKHHPDWTVHRASARAEDVQAVEVELDEVAPDRVVLMIGRTHGPGYSTIDYLEQPGKLVENLNDNMMGVITVCAATEKRGIHTTYLGTGCIFDGYDHAYTEEDRPDFFGSSYSVVKGVTDRMIRMFSHVLTLRIRMPITHTNNPRNFISKITTYKKVCSTPNSMTVLDDFIPVFSDMIETKLTGVFNCTNPGMITHQEILDLYTTLVDKDFTYSLCGREELSTLIISARSNNEMDTTKLTSIYPDILPIRDSIIRVLASWEK